MGGISPKLRTSKQEMLKVTFYELTSVNDLVNLKMQTKIKLSTIVFIDLTKGKITTKTPPTQDIRDYLGGRGLGIKYLSEIAPIGVDPFSPDNPLIITTGPFTGVGTFSAFFSITTKSPLTNTATSSHCGGYWGPKLQQTGYNGIILQGAAKTPQYLVIEDNHIYLKPADHLWGKGTFETTDILQEAYPNSEVLTIGQAGENKVYFASIMNRHRAAGRGGVGAVMGSKLFKAIVVKGNKHPTPSDPEAVKSISRKRGKTALSGSKPFANYGSSMAFSVFNEAGTLPTRNFRSGNYKQAESINAETLKKNHFIKNQGCFACPLRCGNINTVKDGRYKLKEVEGPEYETLMSFGSSCDNENLDSILMANKLCNDYGLDTISCGNTIAFTMDIFDLGLINKNDLDDIEMNWGNHESIIQFISKIALRDGVGNLLADGSYRAGKAWGSKAFNRVIHSKKMEFPGYGARRSFATGFSLVTSNRGACHLRSAIYTDEIFDGAFEKDGFEAHMNVLIDKEHLMCIADSVLLCKFGLRNGGYTWSILTDLINGLTGLEFGENDIQKIGERIWNHEKIYNIREGEATDTAPPRFFTEKLEDNGEGGDPLNQGRFNDALQLYYKLRGWDKNGNPTLTKIKELSIL